MVISSRGGYGTREEDRKPQEGGMTRMDLLALRRELEDKIQDVREELMDFRIELASQELREEFRKTRVLLVLLLVTVIVLSPIGLELIRWILAALLAG